MNIILHEASLNTFCEVHRFDEGRPGIRKADEYWFFFAQIFTNDKSSIWNSAKAIVEYNKIFPNQS